MLRVWRMIPASADIIEGVEGAAFASQDDTPATRRESCVRWRTLHITSPTSPRPVSGRSRRRRTSTPRMLWQGSEFSSRARDYLLVSLYFYQTSPREGGVRLDYVIAQNDTGCECQKSALLTEPGGTNSALPHDERPSQNAAAD